MLKVNGHSDRWLAQGFPWVYPNEVVGGLPAAGAEVRVEGPNGVARGRAIVDHGWIAARIMRADGGPLDDAWLDGLLDAAARRREGLVGSDTSGWRWLHAENDQLPGLRLDVWDGHAVVILDSPVLAPLARRLVDRLVARGGLRTAWLSYRPDPRDTRVARPDDVPPGQLYGEPLQQDVVITERGMKMAVRPWEGPDVGSYPDMREVRAWLAPHWAGRRVLNTFAYTAAFSVAAALGGAERVVSVDLSRPYLERAKANFLLNGLDVEAHAFEVDDSFKALDRARRTGQRFDRVILDPPSFSHGPAGTWSAKQDMPRLVSAGAHVLSPGGWLVVASNQGQVSPRDFRGQVAQGIAKAGRSGAELAFFGAAPDHPARVTFPEAHYLKVGVWVLD